MINRIPTCLLGLSFALAVLSCGSEPTADDASDAGNSDAATDVLVEEDAGGIPCETNGDCPSGWWCTGGVGCDTQWFCQEENPCSAAAPFVACTCRGTYDYVGAGCPNEHWAYYDDRLPQYLLGTPCDGTEATERIDITLRGEDFEAYEGERVVVSWIDNELGIEASATTAVISDGVFEVVWYDMFDPDYFGYLVQYWVDSNGDLSCSLGEQAFTVFIGDYSGAGTMSTTVTTPMDRLSECP